MNERLADQIRNQATANISPVSEMFVARLESEEGLTRDENPQTHFCVYFAAYDPEANQIFIGHHRKSDLWLFNGGHIDEGETMDEALLREIGEEWGLDFTLGQTGEPRFLSITEIDNPTKQTCTRHYDIWYFVPVNKNSFNPDEDLLNKEFHETNWLSPDEARNVVVDPSTLEAIAELEKMFN